MMRINRNSKGFTLIELLIVVAIIGILAAIAIPAYTGYTKKARIAGVVHAMGAVKNAICAYYTETSDGVIPTTTSGADPTIQAHTDSVASTFGITPTTKYGFFGVSGGTGTATITARLANLDTTLNAQNITLTTTDFKEWTWSGSVATEYIPKN